MADTLRTFRVVLSSSIEKFRKGFNEAGKEVGKLEKQLKGFGKRTESIGRALLPASAAVAGFGAAAIKFASDFESSFAGVRKTVDATEAQFQALAQGFRDMAKEIPISVEELNSIGEAAGQLGIETENILGFTRTMAELGLTTNLSAEEAATALARLANITGLPQDQFDRLGSAVVGLGNNFATTEAEIVDFGLRIAGAGELAGLTEPQILAIGTAMSSIGVQAEAGGTSVQKVLNAMTQAVATNSEELRIFAQTAGLSAEQFAEAFRQDAAGAFTAFVEGLGREGDAAFETLHGLGLENERVIRAFLGLANAGDLLSRTLKLGTSAWEENTALAEEARKRYETFASQAKVLWNQIKDLGITIGTALLPVLRDLVQLVTKWLPVIESLAKRFAELPEPVRATALAIGAITAAAGPALIGIGLMANGLGALASTVKVVSGALTGLGGTIGLVFAVGGAAYLLTSWIVENTEAGQKLTAWLGDFINKLRRVDLNQLEQGRDITAEWTDEQRASLEAFKKRQAAIAAETSATSALTDRVQKHVAVAAKAAGLSATDIVQKLKAKEATDKLAQASSLLGEKVTDLATATRILAIAEELETQKKKRQKEALDNIIHAQQREIEHYTKLSKVLDDVAVPALNELIRSTEDGAQEIDALAPLVAKANAELAQLAKDVPVDWGFQLREGTAKALKDLPDVIVGAIQGGGDVFRSVGASIGGTIGSELAESLTSVLQRSLGDKIGGLLGGLVPGLGSIFGGALGALFDRTFGAIGGAISGLFHDEEEDVNDLRDAFFEAQGGYEELGRRITEVSNGIIADDYIKRIFNAETVEEFQKASQEALAFLGDQTALQAEAQDALNDAVERYQFSLEELGPAMQRQELDKQAAQLLKDFNLLTASGIDVNTVIEKMGPNILDFVNTSRAAGQAIPAAMKPMIDQLIQSGQLVDENGRAFASAEEAGITFAETLSEGLTRAVDAIDRLVAALTGIPPVNIPVNVNYNENNRPTGIPSPPVPEFQTGGIVRTPMLARVGEVPEAIIPLEKLDELIAGEGSSETNLNVAVELSPLQTHETVNQTIDYLVAQVRNTLAQSLAQEIQAGRA